MPFIPLPSNLKRPFKRIYFHSLLFVFFLLSIPFSIRKVFGVFSPDSSFNEYLDVSLYLSDVLLIAVLIVTILENKKILLSISYWRRMFHVEHLLLPIFIPAFFILWSGLSIFWSENTPLAIVALSRLIEGYLLYIYIVINNVPRGTFDIQADDCSTWNKFKPTNIGLFHVEQFKDDTIIVPRGTFVKRFFDYIAKCSTWNIVQIILTMVVISGAFQSIVAILQFLSQKSLGLTFLKESIFTVYDSGIAKIVIDGHAFIRSYGLFLHPNILGGFLAVSLLITIAYPLIFKLKMFHVEHCKNIWLYRGIIFIQLLALSFSFSKSAIVAFLIGVTVFLIGIRKMFHVEQLRSNVQNVPRGTTQVNRNQKCSTWNILYKSIANTLNKMFHVEHLAILSGIILTIIIISVINLNYFIVQPIIERLFFMESISRLFRQYYFEGLGIGQYVFEMQNFYSEKLLLWQWQPIHNVFLLILSEIGLVGLCLFVWFLVFVFMRNNSRCTRENIFYEESSLYTIRGEENLAARREASTACLFHSLLIIVVFIMLFDHYFWDIQQGQLLLWIILALAVCGRNRTGTKIALIEKNVLLPNPVCRQAGR